MAEHVRLRRLTPAQVTGAPEPAGQEERRRGLLEDFAVRASTAARTSRLDAAAVEVLDACATVGVEPLLLKGAVLARTLYGSDEVRGYYDIDLLVSPEDLSVAGEILDGLGYSNITDLQGVEDVAGSVHAQMWSCLLPEMGNLTVDLHWRLEGCEAPPETVWSVLNAEPTVIEVQGREVRALSRAGLALHLALHTAQHGPDDVKAVADLSRGLERWPPEVWQEAADLAREVHAGEALSAGLRLVPGGDLVARRLQLPSGDAVLLQLAQRGARPRGTFHLQAFAEAGGLKDRMKLLHRSLVPSRAWIEWEHPEAANSRLRLCAAYCVHFLRAPAWAARAWRFRRRMRSQAR